MFSFLSILGNSPPTYLSQTDCDHLRSFEPVRSFDWLGSEIENPLRCETWGGELNHIIRGIDSIVNSYFGADIELYTKTSPWTAEFHPNFYECVAAIAREDFGGNSWDNLLADSKQRTFLIRGAILKCIELEVFCDPLYGANKAKLKVICGKTIQSYEEGPFEHSRIRAEQCQTYLENHGKLPEKFWECADDSALAILVTLLPFYSLIEQRCSDPNMIGTRATLHQDIHTVVSAAAWLSISIRCHPGIMEWKWPKPGDKCDWTQINASDSMWKASEAHLGALLDQESEKSLVMARVKIVVTPQISCITVGKVLNLQGKAQTTLVKPTVVFYAGDQPVGRALLEDLGIPLMEHVEKVTEGSFTLN